MSKATITNSDSIGRTSPSAKKRLLALNREVVECRVCPRLVNYRESVAKVKKKQFLNWNYWGRPVPGFGDIKAPIIVIGLAPAPHGGEGAGRGRSGGRGAGFCAESGFQGGYADHPPP